MNSVARLEGHQHGLKALRAGDYGRAVSVFDSTLNQHGPHVALLADLAGAHYLSGDMGRFASIVERLEADFTAVVGALSDESRIRTHICLAKYCEELGRIAEAFAHIEAAVQALEPGSRLAVQTRCQKLRLLSTYGRESEVAELYRYCVNVSENPADLRLECFHALCLAEARLFGLPHAWPRFKALAESAERQAADLRLCAVDLLEVAIEIGDAESQSLLLSFLQNETLDPYEEQMVRLARGEEIHAGDLFRWSRALAPQAYLRLLALSVLQAHNAEIRQELQSRFHFVVQSYDHRTRKIMRAKWAKLGGSAGERLEVILRAGKNVMCGEKTLSFAGSHQSWIVLEALSENVVSPPELLTRLAKRGESLENLESLRLLLLRLNKKLSAFLGMDWVVKYRKDGLLMQDSVAIKKADT